jgi:polycomb protein EED
MRFGLSSPLSTGALHPILSICNSQSKVFFWDLARLTEYYKYTTAANGSDKDGIERQPTPPQWLTARAKVGRPRIIELRSAATPFELSAPVKRKYALNSPLKMLEAHRKVILHMFNFNCQQMAWSVCGQWCVVAAAPNAVVILSTVSGSEK